MDVQVVEFLEFQSQRADVPVVSKFLLSLITAQNF